MKYIISAFMATVLIVSISRCNLITEKSNYITVNDLIKIKEEGLAHLNSLANDGLLKFSNKEIRYNGAEVLIYEATILVNDKTPYRIEYIKDPSFQTTGAIAYSFQKDDYGRFKNQIVDLGFKLGSTSPTELVLNDGDKTKVEGIREVFSDEQKNLTISLEQVGNSPEHDIQSLVNLKVFPYIKNYK